MRYPPDYDQQLQDLLYDLLYECWLTERGPQDQEHLEKFFREVDALAKVSLWKFAMVKRRWS